MVINEARVIVLLVCWSEQKNKATKHEKITSAVKRIVCKHEEMAKGPHWSASQTFLPFNN